MTLVGPEVPIVPQTAEFIPEPVEAEEVALTLPSEDEAFSVANQEKLEAQIDMRIATARFNVAVAMHEPVELAPHERDTEIFLTDVDSAEHRIEGWAPRVRQYASRDPWQEANPELAQATNDMIEATMAVTRRSAGSEDPSLAYLDGKRANGGRKATIATEALIAADETMGTWIKTLPRAENLRAVAQPWKSVKTILRDKNTGEFTEIESSNHLIALTGGSGDGRAVREREAWERQTVTDIISAEQLAGGELRLTSLGTGTGEPAMDSGIAIVRDLVGEEGKVSITGYDVNPNSLAIAQKLAERKSAELGAADAVEFTGAITNLLSAEGLAKAVSDSDAHVYEAIGFAEYVPSANAKDPVEQQMRAMMARGNLLSAEDFYKTIYDNMPQGSVLITGNMRRDSPQGDFVTDGLGWPGIIKRDTNEYLTILRDAGIPAEAVDLFVPDQEKSAAAYNLVAIRKI